MARYLTGGVVVLADVHPNTLGCIELVREYTERRYALAEPGTVSPEDFLEVSAPTKSGLSIASLFSEAARRELPWVALRRDFLEPTELLAEMMQGAGRNTSDELPGFAVLLTSARFRPIDRILCILDRSDDEPSGLSALAAVRAAELTGADIDVLVIGSPHEELDTRVKPDRILRVERDKDLYEQAKRRAENLEGVEVNWMFVDHVESRENLVRDVLAAEEYDLVVDDLGNINLGSRLGRSKRIARALGPDGPASIVLDVLAETDLPVLLVLDSVRLGLVSPKVAAGAGVTVLSLGILAGTATASPANPASTRSRTRHTVATSAASDTYGAALDAYDQALQMAAEQASAAEVAAAQEEARASLAAADETAEGEAAQLEAVAAEVGTADGVVSDSDSAAEINDETSASGRDLTASAEAASDRKEASSRSAGDDSARADAETAAEDEDDDAEDEEASKAATTAPADLEAAKDVTPAKAKKVSSDDVNVDKGASKSDVTKAQKTVTKKKATVEDAEDAFTKAQKAATKAEKAVQAAADAASEAAEDLSAAAAVEGEAAEHVDAVLDETSGIKGLLPGGPSAEDVAVAEEAHATAQATVEEAAATADEALDAYQEAATTVAVAHEELTAKADEVTAAKSALNKSKAKASAVEDSHEAAVKAARKKAAERAKKLANSRVTPVAKGSYRASAHYHQRGSAWSLGYHTGEDYAAPTGTRVRAAGSGTVVKTGYDGSYGNRVVVKHANGYYTTYNHLSRISVSVGQKVSTTDKIGEVGNTGNSFGSHLHFEVTKGGDGWGSGKFVAPNDWLAGKIG